MKNQSIKPIATYCITNCCAMAIFEIIYEIDDKIKVGLISDSEKRHKITTNKIYNDKNDRLYFKKFGVKYYIDEFIKL